MKFHIQFCLAITLVIVQHVIAINWQVSGGVRWSFNCDFYGNDLHSQRSRGEDCGGICESNSQCTHFTWTNYNHGTCWLKKGYISPNNAVDKTTDSAVCGFVAGRVPNPGQGTSVSGVKGTFWAETSDAGGCQMPNGDYDVTDAIALGQADQLGALKWRQGLCGQVLRIDCGNGPIDTVVASTCNLNSNSCGIDMIGKTWRRATNNQSPGITSCKVELTTRNPMRGNSPLCFHRPNAETNNQYFAIIGLVNTSGKLTSSATLAGVHGRRNNDGWFEFNANGRPLFGSGAEAVFYYEDGSSSRIRLGDCRPGGPVKIFQ